jgi:hypothetical protein
LLSDERKEEEAYLYIVSLIGSKQSSVAKVIAKSLTGKTEFLELLSNEVNASPDVRNKASYESIIDIIKRIEEMAGALERVFVEGFSGDEIVSALNEDLDNLVLYIYLLTRLFNEIINRENIDDRETCELLRRIARLAESSKETSRFVLLTLGNLIGLESVKGNVTELEKLQKALEERLKTCRP